MRIVLLCICMLVGAAQALAEDIRLTNGEWPPYLGQTLPHQGIASRIVAEAFALEGVEVKWDFYPWARSMMLAQRGQRAGTAVWIRSEQRDKDFYVSDPVVDSGYYLFHRKDVPVEWKQVEDLKGFRIGGANGFDYGPAFQQAEANGTLDVARQTNEELALRQLLAGRIDVLPIDKTVAFDMLHQHFSQAERAQLTFSPKPLRSDTLHLMLSRAVPGNAELITRFNNGLKQLRDSGKIAQYLMEAQQPLSLAP